MCVHEWNISKPQFPLLNIFASAADACLYMCKSAGVSECVCVCLSSSSAACWHVVWLCIIKKASLKTLATFVVPKRPGKCEKRRATNSSHSKFSHPTPPQTHSLTYINKYILYVCIHKPHLRFLLATCHNATRRMRNTLSKNSIPRTSHIYWHTFFSASNFELSIN